MNRKQFLVLAAGSFAAASCESVKPAALKTPRVVDAGPVGAYSAEGSYGGFRGEGFFLARRRGKLIALSSFCTHRHCKLDAESDRSFSCPCHGSTFDSGGKVTAGPATRDLPELPLSIDARGHVLVTVA